jgi:hypothetical protein
MNDTITKESIFLTINELPQDSDLKEFNVDNIFQQISNEELDNNIAKIINYSENFTLKDLYLICEYYGFIKDVKSNKCNKELTIKILVDFESNPENLSIVSKRLNLWFYINELKNDKFMKKYVLW